MFSARIKRGKINRAFGNRTQTKSILRLSSIEFGNRTKQTNFVWARFPNQSNCVRPCSVNKFNWTKIMLWGLKNNSKVLCRINSRLKKEFGNQTFDWLFLCGFDFVRLPTEIKFDLVGLTMLGLKVLKVLKHLASDKEYYRKPVLIPTSFPVSSLFPRNRMSTGNEVVLINN